uniref:Uncharacterized protein n=1 Tax=Gossypium raimondii TaxID=29730 RepID=A0A0D2W7B6_GOSRA|nr:hypothetical protein B456_013G185300 [Gossypium raimondii]
MALLQPTSLVFTVERQEPELIVPAKPTPHECKLLSDTDDQAGHRFQIRGLHIYRNNACMQGKDPVRVIREALAETLEGPNRKLMVDCSGEGILFIEGDADVTLEDFGDSLHPPFPCFKELLYELPASIDLLNSPLLQIQVTRFNCGGFIFAHRFNHTSDAVGLIQFMSTMGEMARGAVAPSIPPLWERHLLNARDPPLITCAHLEYDHDKAATGTIMPTDNLVHRSFFFGPTQISALRRSIPDNLRCSAFDILTACIWRCRTKALELGPDEDVRFICTVNARSKFDPPLPLGYYGNALGYPAVETTAAKLCQNPLEYAIKLVKEAKGKVTEEYMKSTADLMVIRGRPNVNTGRSLIVSDLSRARFREVDFGWGKAENKEGKEGITVPVCLPAPLMDSFVKEINRLMLKEDEATGG